MGQGGKNCKSNWEQGDTDLSRAGQCTDVAQIPSSF